MIKRFSRDDETRHKKVTQVGCGSDENVKLERQIADENAINHLQCTASTFISFVTL